VKFGWQQNQASQVSRRFTRQAAVIWSSGRTIQSDLKWKHKS
jgi:hypothetical protein